MATMLTNEEKIDIVNQHIRNLEFSLYNVELDLIEANSVDTPATFIEEINKRKSDIATKISVLQTERSSLE